MTCSSYLEISSGKRSHAGHLRAMASRAVPPAFRFEGAPRQKTWQCVQSSQEGWAIPRPRPLFIFLFVFILFLLRLSGISEEQHFLAGVRLDGIKNGLVLVLVHPEDYALGNVLLVKVDIEPVALRL